MTPLMAAAGGHEEVVGVLQTRGADTTRRAAAHARAAGHPRIAERLDTVVDKDQTIW